MNNAYRYFISFLLTASLATPVAIGATSKGPQEERRQEQNQRDRNNSNRRVYDQTHKDYHNWDDNEDRAYRQRLSEQHRKYRDFSKQNRKQQDEYWNWRHDHR